MDTQSAESYKGYNLQSALLERRILWISEKVFVKISTTREDSKLPTQKSIKKLVKNIKKNSSLILNVLSNETQNIIKRIVFH